MTTYQILGAAKFGGRCVMCGCDGRVFEVALVRGENKKFAVVHVSCLGGGARWKNKIGGDKVLVGAPESVVLEG